MVRIHLPPPFLRSKFSSSRGFTIKRNSSAFEISDSRQIFNLKYSLSRNLYACLINHLILLRNPFIPALPICRKIGKLISRSVLTIVLDSVESMNPLLIASGQPLLTSPRFRFRSSPRLPCGELPDAPELSPLRRRCPR